MVDRSRYKSATALSSLPLQRATIALVPELRGRKKNGVTSGPVLSTLKLKEKELREKALETMCKGVGGITPKERWWYARENSRECCLNGESYLRRF